MKLVVQEGGLKRQRRNTEAKAHAKIGANFRHGEGGKYTSQYAIRRQRRP